MIAPGTVLGNCKVLRLLAAGGMGQVYVAEDTRLERRIALKVLPAEMAADPERLERFEREAKAVASLNHPNIVTIHSVEEAPGPAGDALYFITMELVEGRTLDCEIPHGGLALDRFFAVAVPLADAVGAAHQRGITHRDLKPGNVMLTTEGRLKVLDFGLAKLTEHGRAQPFTDPTAATQATVPAAPITEEGKVLGTVAYMSPEQAEGKPVDNRSDIFSLGIMLYEMATGALPFTGDTKMSLMSSIIKDTPVPVTEIKRELPNHLGRIIRHCLEKNPERRFQSAQDVRNDLAGLKDEIDSGMTVATQSSMDAMRSSDGPPAAAPPMSDPPSGSAARPSPVTDPAQVSGAAPQAPDPSARSGAVGAPSASDPGTAPIPAAPGDPGHVSSGSGEAPAVALAAPPSGLLSNKLALAGIAAAAVLIVGLAWWTFARDTGASGASMSSSGGGDATTVADARPSVAVLYFDNLSGDTSLDWLRSGLTELLVTDLSQSPELRVLTTDALFEILQNTGNLDARTTSASLVRQVAERGNVDHVVVGSFIRAGDTFRLSARLQRPGTGETLAAETVEGAGEDSVFGSVDTLTRSIKERLAVPISTAAVVDRDLSDVTTTSMDAYRHYTDGVNLISQSRYAEAVAVFERAIEIDPEFAMAFAKLSIVHRNLFDFDTARVYAEKAIEHADRLTQRERFYIEGRYYAQDAETTLQSIEAYENALELYPDDSASRNNVALEYGEVEQFDRAIEHFEELLRRGTPFLPSYVNAAIAYVRNDECARGLDLVRDFVRAQPEYHFGYSDLAQVALLCGNLEEADAALGTYEESIEAGAPGDVLDGNLRFYLHLLAEAFDAAAEANEDVARSTSPAARYRAYPNNRIVLDAYRGRYRDALAAATELARSLADDDTDKAALWADIAEHYLAVGDIEQALQAADRARALAQRVQHTSRVAALNAVAHARVGRSVAARTAAQQHERLSAQLPNPWARRRELFVAAELARAAGDLEEAVDRLQAAVDLLPPGPGFPVIDDFVEYTYALATAHYASGDHVAAATLFSSVTEAGAQRVLRPHEYVRSFYYLGKIAELDGDDAAARRHYQRFLDYWGDGEIDTDRVAEARAFAGGS